MQNATSPGSLPDLNVHMLQDYNPLATRTGTPPNTSCLVPLFRYFFPDAHARLTPRRPPVPPAVTQPAPKSLHSRAVARTDKGACVDAKTLRDLMNAFAGVVNHNMQGLAEHAPPLLQPHRGSTLLGLVWGHGYTQCIY